MNQWQIWISSYLSHTLKQCWVPPAICLSNWNKFLSGPEKLSGKKESGWCGTIRADTRHLQRIWSSELQEVQRGPALHEGRRVLLRRSWLSELDSKGEKLEFNLYTFIALRGVEELWTELDVIETDREEMGGGSPSKNRKFDDLVFKAIWWKYQSNSSFI